MLAGGGVLMFISPLLDWASFSAPGFSVGFAGTETNLFGFQGIFVLLMGIAVAAVGIIKGFAPQISLPDEVLGLSVIQIASIFAFTTVLLTVGQLFGGDAAIGLYLGIVGGGLALAGAITEGKSAPSTASSF